MFYLWRYNNFLFLQITFDRVKKINKLKPYTRYVFIVGIGNYYSQLEGKDPVTGDPAIYRTAPGSNIFEDLKLGLFGNSDNNMTFNFDRAFASEKCDRNVCVSECYSRQMVTAGVPQRRICRIFCTMGC